MKGHIEEVRCLDAKGGYVVSGGTDNLIKIWLLETRACIKTLVGHRNWVRTIKIHNDQEHIISGSFDTDVRIWSIQTGNCLKVLSGHKDYISSISCFGDILLSSSFDHSIKIWDMKTGKCVATLCDHTNRVAAVDVTAYNREVLFVSVSYDCTLRLWTSYSGRFV
uniref:Uncharacterized protein n=1 Tax=Arcella intermedia TaxID=1963864 RepID=A0A6B2LK67_9EUKA